MVVKDNDNKDEKKENIGKNIGLWISRIIVMILFLYLAAILFNYFPLLPIYGATYLPLDNKLFKAFNETNSDNKQKLNSKTETNLIQNGGGSSLLWGGNITDLIQLYINVYKELDNNKDIKFNLEGGTPDKTVGELINTSKNTSKNVIISNIIKNMLRNPTTMKTIRDTMSKKSKHFFASIPITTALLKIAEFSGVANIDKSGNIIEGTNFGSLSDNKFNNPEGKEQSIASIIIENDENLNDQIVYDVNKFCTKNMILWYLKQFFVLVGSTIGAIFMWPIYYLHEVDIVQKAPVSETGNIEPCQGESKGKALQIIILIIGLIFMIYNAYARCYSFTESIVYIFKTKKLEKTLSNIILWVSIVGGIIVGIIGFFLFRNYETVRTNISASLKNKSQKVNQQISSMLSQPILRGLIDHYGLVKSAIICVIGSIILGSIWSMSLTGSWTLLAIFAFFFPIAGLILIYLTQSEILTLFSNSSNNNVISDIKINISNIKDQNSNKKNKKD